MEPNVRVVLVDDEPDIRNVVRTMLEVHGGFDVVGEAPDGEQAVTVCRETQPDLVVLDLMMPVLDGAAAAPLIKQAAPAAKIAVLSAVAGEPLWEAAQTGPADAYFEKTIAIQGMPALLHALAQEEPRHPAQPILDR